MGVKWLITVTDNISVEQQARKVYPPADVLVSRGQARTTLARLRALQEASGRGDLLNCIIKPSKSI